MYGWTIRIHLYWLINNLYLIPKSPLPLSWPPGLLLKDPTSSYKMIVQGLKPTQKGRSRPIPSGGVHSDYSVPTPAGLAIKDCGCHRSPQPRDAGTGPVLSPFIFWFFQTYIHTSNTIMHTEELASCIGILWGMSQEHTMYTMYCTQLVEYKLCQMRGSVLFLCLSCRVQIFWW